MFEAIAIGASAGGLRALQIVLSGLPASFPLTIAIVQHMEPQSDTFLSEYLNQVSAISVKEAEDKETLQPGTAYLAPAGYHLLIEPNRSFSLSVDEKVNYSRTAIDPLFESAADVFGAKLIGILLTGANHDGAQGLKIIKQRGGMTIVQNPKTAESPSMPKAALNATQVDHVLDLEQILPLLEIYTSQKGAI